MAPVRVDMAGVVDDVEVVGVTEVVVDGAVDVAAAVVVTPAEEVGAALEPQAVREVAIASPTSSHNRRKDRRRTPSGVSRVGARFTRASLRRNALCDVGAACQPRTPKASRAADPRARRPLSAWVGGCSDLSIRVGARASCGSMICTCRLECSTAGFRPSPFDCRWAAPDPVTLRPVGAENHRRRARHVSKNANTSRPRSRVHRNCVATWSTYRSRACVEGRQRSPVWTAGLPLRGLGPASSLLSEPM